MTLVSVSKTAGGEQVHARDHRRLRTSAERLSSHAGCACTCHACGGGEGRPVTQVTNAPSPQLGCSSLIRRIGRRRCHTGRTQATIRRARSRGTQQSCPRTPLPGRSSAGPGTPTQRGCRHDDSHICVDLPPPSPSPPTRESCTSTCVPASPATQVNAAPAQMLQGTQVRTQVNFPC